MWEVSSPSLAYPTPTYLIIPTRFTYFLLCSIELAVTSIENVLFQISNISQLGVGPIEFGYSCVSQSLLFTVCIAAHPTASIAVQQERVRLYDDM